ncbi:MAG: YfhO family protein [Blautia massiliensis (ex Durand et al. 2017)]
MIVAVLVTSILLNVSYQYSYEKDYLSEFEEKDQALEKLQSGPDKAIRSMDDSAVTRYDQYKTGSYVNTAMYMGTNSTSYYFSVANGNISRFFDEMYLNTPWDYHYSSLDGRSILDRLALVKYFAIKKSGYGYLPYGYDSEAAVTKKYRIYEDEDSLPLGYTYDSWIPREKYEKLSVTEKQQALLQGAVLEDSSLSETDLIFDDKKADFTLEAGKGCKIKDGKIIVAKEGATVQIGYQGEPEAEVYLVAKNLDFNAYSPRAVVSDKKMGFHDRI